MKTQLLAISWDSFVELMSGWTGIVILACITPLVLIKALAKHNLPITTVKQNEVKVVTRNGKARKTLSHKKIRSAFEPSCVSKIRSIWGFFWVGVPFIDKVYTYRLRWHKAYQKDDGSYTAEPRNEIVDSVRLNGRYVLVLKNLETEDNIPVNGMLAFEIVVEDVLELLFGMKADFLESIQERILNATQVLIGATSITKLPSLDIDSALSGIKTGTINGARITKISLLQLDPPEERRKELASKKSAIIAREVAHENAEALKLTGEAQAHVTRVTGTAKADNIKADGVASASAEEAMLKARNAASADKITRDMAAEVQALQGKKLSEEQRIMLELKLAQGKADIQKLILLAYKDNPVAGQVALAEALGQLKQVTSFGLGSDRVLHGIVNPRKEGADV